jgi:hypothetical protein
MFPLVTLGHFRLRSETGANVWVIGLGIGSTVAVLVTFVVTTLVNEPKTLITMG